MPKTIDTLAVLLERRGQVVEKAELMKLVWPDCVVEEVGLARNISLLRQALGSDGEAYIETVPRRGYRFTPAGDEAADPLPVVKRSALPALLAAACAGALLLVAFLYWQFYQPSRFSPARGERALLAVATLQSTGPELERAAFSIRFTDTLVGEIAKLDSVQLISPSTVRRYEWRGIPVALMGRLLGLDVIVEGTAQQFGSQVRIALRMSDVHSGRLIWAESYDCPSGDQATAESTVARAAAEQIGRHLKH
jgi:TolB-like protein